MPQKYHAIFTGALNIAKAEAVALELKKLVASRRKTLSIKIDQVAVIDLACVQLFIAFRRSAEAAGKTVKFTTNFDRESAQLLNRAGFTAYFAN